MTSGALARAGLTVTGAFLLSRVLGWVRVVVLGNLYGDQLGDLDAYYAAFRIPDLIYQLVAAGAIASALVPVLSGLLAEGQRDRAWRVASTVANLVLIALAIAALVMFVLAPQVVPLLVNGESFDAEKTARTVELTRLMLLSPVFLALGAVASAILNTEGRFAASAIAPVMYNLSIIVFAVALAPVMGVTAAALGVVAGSLLHVAVQLPALRGHFRWTRHIGLEDGAAREALALMMPRAIGLGASQITFIVNTALASSVLIAGLGTDGAVTVYNVAFNVLQIPLGIIAVPVGIVLLPALSRARATGEDAHFAALVAQTLRLLLWICVFLSATGIVLRSEVVDVLFGFGFEPAALDATAATLGVFLLGLPAHALNVILARAFYSGRDTATPVAVAIASVGVNVVVSLLTVERLGLLGLALGIALGGWFETVTLILLLRRRVPAFPVRPLAAGVVFLGGGIVAGIVAWLVVAAIEALAGPDQRIAGELVALVLAGSAAGVAYLLYSRVVRIPEPSRAVGLLRSARRRG